ncbi:DUF559 domain-containing protein [Tsukamurella spumae]|uniref:DUF559 domain-containing protein n=1 Tax=Tsukamurella spumae TaxID=44753 RepID=UPI0014482794|nr:DUF559 domain-containing protein [Tsukamurella spumae]
MGESELRRLIADQDGVVTIAQCHEHGLTAQAVHARVKSERWSPLARGVYLSAEHHFTDAARIRAAVALTGGTVDAATALFWHGLVPEAPLPTTVSVPRSRHRTPTFLAPLELHRRDLLDADVEELRGLRITRRPLTLLDCVGVRSDATALLDRALQTGDVTVPSLRAALERNAGRHGMAEARRVVEVVESDTESEAEREFADLMLAEGISGWETQLPIGRYRADFTWPEEQLVVEVDGWAFHKDAVRFQRDHDKRNDFARRGLTVLAFTWHDVVNDPVGTVEAVVAVLRERRGAAS